MSIFHNSPSPELTQKFAQLRNALLIVFTLLAVTSCSTIDTKVTVYHNQNINNELDHKSYAYFPLKDQIDNMQYDFVTSKLDTYLSLQTMQKVSFNDAQVVLLVTYSTGKGKNYEEYQPIIGQTGSQLVSSSTIGSYDGTNSLYDNGALSGTTSSQTTYQTQPTYGVTGYVPEEVTYYPYYVFISIYKKRDFNPKNIKANKPIYEAMLVSTNNNYNPNSMYANMLDGLFQIFPGDNGESTTVRVNDQDNT
jgi:hypothetical protein